MAQAAAGVKRERCVSSDASGGASGGVVGVARCLRNRAAEPNRETHPARRPQTATKERGRPDAPRTRRAPRASCRARRASARPLMVRARPATRGRSEGAAHAERRSGREKNQERQGHHSARERPCSTAAARTTHARRTRAAGRIARAPPVAMQARRSLALHGAATEETTRDKDDDDRRQDESRTKNGKDTTAREKSALLGCGGENHPRTTHARRRPHPRPPPTAPAVSATAAAAAATAAAIAARRDVSVVSVAARTAPGVHVGHARYAPRATDRSIDQPTAPPTSLRVRCSQTGRSAKCHKGGGGCEEAHTQRAAAARTNLRVPVVRRTCRQSAVTVVARLRRPRTCAHAGSQLYYQRTLIDYVIIVTW